MFRRNLTFAGSATAGLWAGGVRSYHKALLAERKRLRKELQQAASIEHRDRVRKELDEIESKCADYRRHSRWWLF